MKNKKILAVLIAAALAAGLAAPAFAAGTTIHISSSEELRKLARDCQLDTYSEDLTVVLDKDIDLGDSPFSPIPVFNGSFNGNGHTVSGFTLATDGSHQGFFRYIGKNGTVSDLKVEGYVEPGGEAIAVGGIVGTNYGTVSGCSFKGTVTGNKVTGGIAGNNYGTIRACSAEGKISALEQTGGIVGYNEGTVTASNNNAAVNTTITEAALSIDTISLSSVTNVESLTATETDSVSNSGGIAGASIGVISNCNNYATIGYQHYGYNVGGIAGTQSGYITACTNYGQIYGRKDIGGIVGQMEPFMKVQSSATLADELDELSQLVAQALKDSNGNTYNLTDKLDSVASDIANASANARALSNSVGNFIDDNIDTANALLERTQYVITEGAPVTADLSLAAENFSSALYYLDIAMDELEMDDSTRDELKTDLDDLTNALDRVNVELDYLSYLFAVYENKYKDGTNDLKSMRPADYRDIEKTFGYDYGLNEKDDADEIERAFVAVISDLFKDGAEATKAKNAILKLLDDYYLTNIYDTDGDGVPDESRSDRIADNGSLARDYLNAGSAYFSSAMDGVSRINSYLADQPTLTLSNLDSNYYTASDGLANAITSMANNIKILNASIDSTSDIMTADLLAINTQFNKVLAMMADALNGTVDKTVLEDVSENDAIDSVDGKVYKCTNSANIDGDTNVGGITGAMGIEYELDPEDAVKTALGAEGIMSSTYQTRCVIRECVNHGTIKAKKNAAGGIAGIEDMGMIVGCEGYGNVASDGECSGGIVGSGDSVVKDCYAMCKVSGESYVGGIAGKGEKISGCCTLVGIEGVTACTGAIAGWADVTVQDNVRFNYYVHETLGAIDGISYSGAAEPVSYAELTSMTGTPDPFDSLQLTFVADGVIIDTLDFDYGEGVDTSKIPAVPSKDGYSGSWPEYDYDTLYFSDTIEAVYSSKQATMAADTVRENSKLSVVLVEGNFADDASVSLTEYDGAGPEIEDAEVLEKWALRIDSKDAVQSGYKVRYLAPETEKGNVTIYIYNDGKWNRANTTSSGSYEVFNASGDTVVFSAVEQSKAPILWIIGGIGGAGLLGGGLAVLKKKKRK